MCPRFVHYLIVRVKGHTDLFFSVVASKCVRLIAGAGECYSRLLKISYVVDVVGFSFPEVGNPASHREHIRMYTYARRVLTSNIASTGLFSSRVTITTK